MTRVAVYTGSFDPPTLGHLDIVRRAAALADRLVIGVGSNSSKAPLFTLDERIALLEAETASLEHVSVKPFSGLAVDFARAEGAGMIVRGLRNGGDLDYEAPMTGMNATMAPDVETVFLLATPALSSITATLVREVARGHGPVEAFVSADVARQLEVKARG